MARNEHKKRKTEENGRQCRRVDWDGLRQLTIGPSEERLLESHFFWYSNDLAGLWDKRQNK